MFFNIILAGGSGSRFWPRSRENNPKQLLNIGGGSTLIQRTLQRLKSIAPVDQTLVISNQNHADETCRQLAEMDFPPGNLFAEPEGKNTAAAIGLAAKWISRTHPSAIMGIFPADHFIGNEAAFQKVVQEARHLAEQGFMVTLGICPKHPETGYGYIKQGESLSETAFRIERFTEKPNIILAQQFLDEGGYFWNSGMFFWQASVFLESMKEFMPESYKIIENIDSCIGENKGKFSYKIFSDEGEALYASLPSISVDHGIMEKSSQSVVVPADISWNDVGAWSALEEILQKDAQGNIISGDVLAIDCEDSILQGNHRLVAVLGMKDTLVVDSEDALLICDKNRAQEVKKITEKLKKDKRLESVTASHVVRPWGTYTVLEERENYLVKRIEVFSGEKLSLQSHACRSENWTVVQGQACAEKDGENFYLNVNESIFIPQGARHRLSNPGKELLVLIEIQSGSKLDENDIIRYQDIYGRVSEE